MQKIRVPLSVRIISWYLIIGCALTIVLMPFMLNNPQFRDTFHALRMSPEIATLVSVLGAVICFIAGIAMLNRRAWGRTIIIAYTPLSALYGLWMYDFQLSIATITPFIIAALAVFFLLRKNVVRYFSDEPEYVTSENEKPVPRIAIAKLPLWRRVIGVIALVVSGFFLYLFTMGFTSLPHPTHGAALPMAGYFGLPFLALLATGNYLRGWARWKMPTGIVLLSSGGVLLLIASVMLQPNALAPGRQANLSNINPAQMAAYGMRVLTAGGIEAGIGALLIFWKFLFRKSLSGS